MASAQRCAVNRELELVFGAGSVAALSDEQLLGRFVSSRDEAAFSALVARHGPMVLSVCRGVLRSSHDAEDAFQAAFLILARKSSTLRAQETIGGWLHKVAHRVALEANKVNGRRALRERNAARLNPEPRPPADTSFDLVPVLHEEIQRLPDKYRAPIVLCDLESMTREEAAGHLGWPPGTVAGRLARGRDLLRDRLVRRGIVPAVAATTFAAVQQANAAVPQPWIRAAALSAVNRMQAGAHCTVAATDAAEVLIHAVLKAMLRADIRRLVVLTGLLASVFVSMLAAALFAAQKGEPAKIPVSGTVVDSQGKPLAGVAVYRAPVSTDASWGKVEEQSRTDQNGNFRLELKPETGDRMKLKASVIWAYQPGKLLATYRAQSDTVYPDVPLRLVIDPPAQTVFEVRDPEGNPVAGAKIKPRVLDRDYWSVPAVPDGLADEIEKATVTDGNGRAVLTALLAEEIRTVLVSAPGFGSQQFSVAVKRHVLQPGLTGLEKGEIEPRVILLLPVGRVTGRVVGDPAAIRGRIVELGTSDREHPTPYPGLAYAKTDDEGRFVVPAIAAGRLSVNLYDPDPTSPWQAQRDWSRTVDPGQTTDVELKLVKATRVHGDVRERETGKPVPGAKVGLSLHADTDLTSDARGHYEGYTAPGGTFIRLTPPDGYAPLRFGVPDANIPGGVDEFELPPILLSPAGEIRGVVVDEKERPVAGAVVEASWSVNEGPNRSDRNEQKLRTDGRGEFRLDRVPLATEVLLSARKLGPRTTGFVATRVGARELARLKLDPRHAVAMAGRVVDDAGKPVAGAAVRIRQVVRASSGQVMGDELVQFDTGSILFTDTNGQYQTPNQLDRDGEYAAFASARGLQSGWTDWVAGASGSLPELVLQPEKAPAGVQP